ncbi:multicopper oxidase [Trichoderma asperellum CBS 433.97]|uniref:Multicopper oxidase n=1 Tax=Trichoderma asperellum (strain ATCC 204424 / CBS 433.97 / NBRC 101777) TaxID=1042311 RepID=A0A2T3YXQ9_TRIA4|nr:multicopper oxidase [Trichoderma asperellum CBS 433.97]PTB37361.1 multicopper oxidase [Trichoderma asperellum CBS 433.97]
MLLLLLFARLLAAWSLPTNAPPTQVREFDLVVTWAKHAPDGFSRNMFLINEQSPGPTIEVEQNDWVIVRVKNKSCYNTTIHFHGIEMLGTPWSDGVPGLSQRAIPPGGHFVYQFSASQYGSYWYHSHFHGQIEDGLYGPVIIHPLPESQKPFHLISSDPVAIAAMVRAERNVKPVAIADLNHFTSEEKWNMALASGIEDSCYDSILFNGKGRVQCLAAAEVAANLSDEQKAYLALGNATSMTDKSCLPPKVLAALGDPSQSNLSAIPAGAFTGCKETKGSIEVLRTQYSELDTQNWLSLTIIGSLNFITAMVSIDEHDMWIYSMDGAYIEPQKAQALVLTNGDRYGIMVNIKKVGKFNIRCNAVSAPQVLTGHAILEVQGYGKSNESESQPYISITGVPLSKNVTVFNQDIAAPFPPEPISKTADALYKLNMRLDGASYLWALNSTRLMPATLDSDKTPILFKKPEVVHDNTTISTRNGTWIDLVLFASTIPMPPHPIHKHNNKIFQIGGGDGDFPWASVEEAINEKPELFNLINPPRRDSFASRPAINSTTWIVVRYQVVNPGAWLLHCHISNHLLGGMSVIIQDGVDKWPKVPEKYLDWKF